MIEGNGSKYGSASLGIHIFWEYNVVCVVVVVVEVVGGPVYTHSLEYEFSYLYFMNKKVFFTYNRTNILGKSGQVQI